MLLPNLLMYLLLMKLSNVLVFTSPVSMLMKYLVASKSAVVLRSFSSSDWKISSLPTGVLVYLAGSACCPV